MAKLELPPRQKAPAKHSEKCLADAGLSTLHQKVEKRMLHLTCVEADSAGYTDGASQHNHTTGIILPRFPR